MTGVLRDIGFLSHKFALRVQTLLMSSHKTKVTIKGAVTKFTLCVQTSTVMWPHFLTQLELSY